MPRALPKNKINNFVSFLETLKNGYIFDTRYKFTERIFDSPQVWVFTNNLFDKTLLSNDRLNIWCIDDDKELVMYPSMETGSGIPYPIVESDDEEIPDIRYLFDDYINWCDDNRLYNLMWDYVAYRGHFDDSETSENINVIVNNSEGIIDCSASAFDSTPTEVWPTFS